MKYCVGREIPDKNAIFIQLSAFLFSDPDRFAIAVKHICTLRFPIWKIKSQLLQIKSQSRQTA
jgi:hypothetical protein